MTRPYGLISQNAYVVQDIDEAIDFWTGVMRVGPFFKFPEIVFESGFYRGKPHIPQYDAAIAFNGGDYMIELIKPKGPSIFQEFQDAGLKGVQHLGAFADNMAIARADLEARGGVAVLGGKLPDGSEIAYFDMGGPDQVMFEIACLSEAAQGMFAALRDAAANWDGKTKTLSF